MPKFALAVSTGGSVGSQYWGVQCGEHLGCAELAHTVQCLSVSVKTLVHICSTDKKLSIQPCVHNPRLGHQGFWARLSELVNSGSGDRSCLPLPLNKVMNN